MFPEFIKTLVQKLYIHSPQYITSSGQVKWAFQQTEQKPFSYWY
jgi:hypothetical protein